ncbi:alpha/beta hydrolase [Halothiobacillus sp. DCM-1]|uniref:alpha/beta hydrolase n=1 Tax=Halothiobacillus sp. DCM-1 TaxID=3112558 RepID=UPI003244AB88
MSLPRAHLVLLHGLGADASDLRPVGEALAAWVPGRDWCIHTPAAPVAPVSLNGGLRMPSWFDIYGIEPTAPVDQAGIAAAAGRIAAEIDTLPGDAPVWLGGFSQGGVVALHAACRVQRPLAGLMLLSTWLPDATGFAGAPACIELPIFVGHGTQDDIVPAPAAERLVARLRAVGATALTARFYPMAHQICPEELGDLAEWMSAASG